jgi:DNA polymerase-3 subunit alpha
LTTHRVFSRSAGNRRSTCTFISLKINWIKYELFFERFISKARAKKTIVDGVTYFDGSLFPDVDLDICYYNRHRVIAYLEEKFKGKTSKILTLNTLSSKLCIKESGKVVAEKQESEMNDVSSYIPKLFGQVKSLEEAVTESEKFAEWVGTNQEVYKIALKLQNLNKNKGVHPSGLLLAHSLLEESCPVELSSDKQVVSSYDMNNVTAYNIKLDLLGLRGVSVVDDVCKSLGIRYEDIDVNDVFIYQQLQDFKLPHGLFQIEAETNFKVCQKVKPKNLEQLSGVLALARPGALQFIDKYANYTNNDHYESIHPFFDDILGVTGGVCLYQEQLMKMVSKVGFSLDEAEIVRRCVGKKKVEEMKEWEVTLMDGLEEEPETEERDEDHELDLALNEMIEDLQEEELPQTEEPANEETPQVVPGYYGDVVIDGNGVQSVESDILPVNSNVPRKNTGIIDNSGSVHFNPIRL